jgi:hypothetical protein
MQKSHKIRVLFVIICLVIVLYLGVRNGISFFDYRKAEIKYPLAVNEVMLNNRSSIHDEDGQFEDWIEIYNKGDTAINLQGFGLSNNSKQPFFWTFPDTVIQPDSYLIIWASQKNKTVSGEPLHTNFKVKNKDKAVILTDPGANWQDIFLLQSMGDNISCGRLPDGGAEIFGFDGGTPGKANSFGEILAEGPSTKRLERPLFSQEGGFYTMPFELVLETREENAEVYFTLDGSVPTRESNAYKKPIPIQSKGDEAAVVRARVYKEGYPCSQTVTQSYFVGKDIYNRYNTPVVSLATDPDNLFGYDRGIYTAGMVFDQWILDNPDAQIKSDTPANYNQRGRCWERQANIEIFETDGETCLNQNIGIRTFGGYSRAGELKSLSLFARKDYDNNDCFEFNLSDDRIDGYGRILLRTSATDSKYALFRDAFIQSLVQPTAILDTQASKPCIVYINGEYYGIHNIREAYDKNYVSTHYNIEPEDVVIVKNPTGIAGDEIEEGHAGDEMHYSRMILYLKERSQVTDIDYDFIKTQMDAEDFIEYCILQIYCDNRDWPGNNVRIWRKRTKNYQPNAPTGHDGRWRWMVFDLDYGFGLHHGTKAVSNNSLARATEENGPSWPNPPWSTFLLRSLLNNAVFKNQFINTFADRLNTIFLPQVVVEKLENMEKTYHPNMIKHIERWGLHRRNIENWKAEIASMKYFAVERPRYMRQHIVQHFELEGTVQILVDTETGGCVRVNSLVIEEMNAPWKGIYFKGIPVKFEAVPNPGFVFEGWQGISKSKERSIMLDLSEESYLKAVFRRKQ